MITVRERKARGVEIIKHLAGEFLLREASKKTFITITRVELNKLGTLALIYCAIIPDKDRENAEKFLKRKSSMTRDYIKKNSRLRIIPTIRFVIDLGSQKSERIQEILSQNKAR